MIRDAPAPSRRSLLKCSGALGAAAAVSSSLAACSAGPESTNDTGGGSGGNGTLTAVIGYGNDGSWDPTQTASAFCMAANNHIYEGLLTLDDENKPIPMLAETMPTVSPDGLTYTFKLRRGIKFHNGKEMTSDDVVASLTRWSKQSIYGKDLFNYVAEGGLRAVDKYTVELKLKEKVSIVQINLAVANNFAAIYPKEIAEKQLASWQDAQKDNSRFK